MAKRSDAPAARGQKSIAGILRQRRITIVCILAAIGLLAWVDHNGWLLVQRNDDLKRYHTQRVVVSYVIDGDTIEVAMADPTAERETTRVRLWGIDCPEVVRDDQPAQPLAIEATELARSAAEGREVFLFLESHQTRDSFGRLLAHVELNTGESLNELLLKAGLARAEHRSPHSLLVQYVSIERGARAKKAGMWASSTTAAKQ